MITTALLAFFWGLFSIGLVFLSALFAELCAMITLLVNIASGSIQLKKKYVVPDSLFYGVFWFSLFLASNGDIHYIIACIPMLVRMALKLKSYCNCEEYNGENDLEIFFKVSALFLSNWPVVQDHRGHLVFDFGVHKLPETGQGDRLGFHRDFLAPVDVPGASLRLVRDDAHFQHHFHQKLHRKEDFSRQFVDRLRAALHLYFLFDFPCHLRDDLGQGLGRRETAGHVETLQLHAGQLVPERLLFHPRVQRPLHVLFVQVGVHRGARGGRGRHRGAGDAGKAEDLPEEKRGRPGGAQLRPAVHEHLLQNQAKHEEGKRPTNPRKKSERDSKSRK